MENIDYTIRLYPFGRKLGGLEIDPEALRGFFEHRDGSEGGGLWFERSTTNQLILVDFDGVFQLPKQVIEVMRKAGIIVDDDFE